MFSRQTMVMVVMVFLLYMFLMPIMLHPLFIKNRPEYIVNKIYFDSYKKYAVGIPYPDVNKTLQRKLNEGLLVLDYVGHGGTEALSDEKVITHNDILGYKYEHLPLWITTTCDFCRFDDIQTSAGEECF